MLKKAVFNHYMKLHRKITAIYSVSHFLITMFGFKSRYLAKAAKHSLQTKDLIIDTSTIKLSLSFS